jgi:hypothetical protein
MTSDGTSPQISTAARRTAPPRLRRTVRILLVVLWVALAALGWWSQPRSADAAEARADLASGRVVAYGWGDGWQSTPFWQWAGPGSLQSSRLLGPVFAWRTTDLRIHYVRLGGADPGFTGDASRYATTESASMGAAVEAAGLKPDSTDVGTPLPLFGVTLLLGLTFLAVLVAGPDPVVGTRWFWYLLVAVGPYGLGVLLWLARERPWSASAVPSADNEPRQRWYVGLGLGFLATIVMSLIVAGLHRLLGDALIPHP